VELQRGKKSRIFLGLATFSAVCSSPGLHVLSQSIGGIDSAWQRLSNAAPVLIAAPILINQRSIKEASNHVFSALLHFHLSLTFQDFVL
jgi:hypothetical protein